MRETERDEGISYTRNVMLHLDQGFGKEKVMENDIRAMCHIQFPFPFPEAVIGSRWVGRRHLKREGENTQRN